MKVFVHTHGCRLNMAESRNLIEQLESRNYVISDAMGKDVDLAIVNTCAVTHSAESKCMQTIRQIIRKNPEVSLIVVGCLAEKNAQSLMQIHDRIYILGNSEKHHILEYVDRMKQADPFQIVVKNPTPKVSFKIPCRLSHGYNKRYNLKIQEGCDLFCSYCIIPTLRGRSRSRDFRDLLEDAAIHVQNGVKEIVLTGVNIGDYENDGKNLSDVVAALNEIPNLLRIRLSSIELNTISDPLLNQMRDPGNKLLQYLHIPIQSGSDRILKLMRRRYNISEAKTFLKRVVREMPDIGLGTDIIAGFPGETEDDFNESVDLIKNSSLQYVHVFSYSRRKGTVADLMKDQQITPEEIEKRSKQLHIVSREKHAQFLERYVGQTLDVLFEDRDRECFPGLTENYIKVVIPKGSEDLTNQLRHVHCTQNIGKYMLGNIE